MGKRSPGSKLGAVSGLAVAVAFFLPWLRSCQQTLTGYQIATNRTGQVQAAWMYWGVLAGGVVCVVLFAVCRRKTVQVAMLSAVGRLVVGVIGIFPLLNLWQNLHRQNDTEILLGGWVTAAGYVGILASYFIDVIAVPDPYAGWQQGQSTEIRQEISRQQAHVQEE